MRLMSAADGKNCQTFVEDFNKVENECLGDPHALVAMWREAWSKLTELIHNAHRALSPTTSYRDLIPSRWKSPLQKCYIRYAGGSRPFTVCAIVPLLWKDGSQMMFVAYDVKDKVIKEFHTALVTQVY